MSITLANPHADSERIFLLSAFGSLMLHTVLFAGLAYLPHSPQVEEASPTVKVRLVPALQADRAAAQPPLKPLAPTRPEMTPPAPSSSHPQSLQSSPAPPLQASFTPTPSIPPPLSQPKPVLKDTRTSQMIQSRQMMKMAVPQRLHQHSSLPPARPQQSQAPVSMPFNLNNQPVVKSASLPPPRNSTAHPALKAPLPHSGESSISSPKIVSSSKPLYPRVARESGWEGTVIVRTLITPDGMPSQVEIRKSCGHEALDLAAQEAIKSWKFHPAKDGNIPIAKWVDIPVKFDLNS